VIEAGEGHLLYILKVQGSAAKVPAS